MKLLWKRHLQNVQTLSCDTVPYYISLEEGHGLFPQLLAIDLKNNPWLFHLEHYHKFRITDFSGHIMFWLLCSPSKLKYYLVSSGYYYFFKLYIRRFKKSPSKLREKTPKHFLSLPKSEILNYKVIIKVDFNLRHTSGDLHRRAVISELRSSVWIYFFLCRELLLLRPFKGARIQPSLCCICSSTSIEAEGLISLSQRSLKVHIPSAMHL